MTFPLFHGPVFGGVFHSVVMFSAPSKPFDKSTVRHKRVKSREHIYTYFGVVDFLLISYAINDDVVNAPLELKTFKKFANQKADRCAEALKEKALRLIDESFEQRTIKRF